MIKTKRKLNNKRKIRTKIKEINQIRNYHSFSSAVRMCDQLHREVRSITLVHSIALEGALECASGEQNRTVKLKIKRIKTKIKLTKENNSKQN
jgi:hypothetical protein